MRSLFSKKKSVAVKICSETNMEFAPLFPNMPRTFLPIFYPKLRLLLIYSTRKV